MALKDYLKRNGFGSLGTLTFKLAADTNVLFPYAKIKATDDGPTIEFVEESDSDTVAVTKNYAFVSYARVWNDTDQKYGLASQTINFCETSEGAEVSVTETLKLEDAAAEGIDTTGEAGPTMQVTHNKGGWAVVSCVKEVQKGEEVVFDGSKDVTINLF